MKLLLSNCKIECINARRYQHLNTSLAISEPSLSRIHSIPSIVSFPKLICSYYIHRVFVGHLPVLSLLRFPISAARRFTQRKTMAAGFLFPRQSTLTALVPLIIWITLFIRLGEASPLVLRALQKRYVQNWQYPGGSGNTPYDGQADAQSRIQFPNGSPPQRFVFFTEIGQFTPDQAVYDFAHANNGIAIRDAYPANYICRLPDNQVQGGANENNRYWWEFGDMVSGVYADLVGQHANNGKGKPYLSYII